MSVLVRIGKQKAILRAGFWVCASSQLEHELNSETQRWIRETGGPSIRERDQEGHVAAEIAKRFGGRVTLHMRTRSRRSAAVFFAQRQLQFDFTSSL